jgi:hypothetical protein
VPVGRRGEGPADLPAAVDRPAGGRHADRLGFTDRDQMLLDLIGKGDEWLVVVGPRSVARPVGRSPRRRVARWPWR